MLVLSLISIATLAQTRPSKPSCTPAPGRAAEALRGSVDRGKAWSQSTTSGWTVRLVPDEVGGWGLQITTKGRESDDLSRLTPPWHGANSREIDGWHFRNASNTGPNDGAVNAPGELREFIFSPEVGRSIEYHGSGTPSSDVDTVRAFGRGWLFIDAYRLTPPKAGERAAFETITFTACLTFPTGRAQQ